MTLKVLLIQPSHRDCIQTLFSIYNTEEGIGFKPPIGLLYIATAIRKMTEHQVDLLDCQLDDIHQGNILEHVKERYDVVGISAWTDFWFQAHGMGKKIKEKYPETHLVYGGPHVNIFPEELLKFPFVDSIILGDGELPIIQLLDKLSGKASLSENKGAIKGIYFAGENPKQFEPFICEDLDSLPIPDRTLLPIERYSSVLSADEYVTTMVTSRGCPFKCVYCKLAFQRPVSRSAESVIAEFREIARLGIKEVEVYDDTFNWSHKRTKAICEGVLKEGIRFKWAVRDRVDRADDEVYALLRKAGCYRVHLGVETGSDRVMKLAKKKISVEQVRKGVALAKKHRFVILTYFMFGLPGETWEDAIKTFDLALELDTDYAEFSITIPYPGTESYDESLKEGIIPEDYWRHFTQSPTPCFMIPYVIENLMGKKELTEIRDIAIKKFYFRPKYMLRELFKVRSMGEFMKKAKMGLGLFNILREKFVR